MSQLSIERLIDHAYKLLSQRPQSEFEIRYKLNRLSNKNKVSDMQKLIDQVVDILKQQNYINDQEFAKWYVGQRQEFKPMSIRRLKHELFQKGIDQITVSKALENYDEDLACRILAHQKRHMDIKRLTNYLLRQGFRWDLVETSIKSQA